MGIAIAAPSMIERRVADTVFIERRVADTRLCDIVRLVFKLARDIYAFRNHKHVTIGDAIGMSLADHDNSAKDFLEYIKSIDD
jgi:hypothetical protein